MSEVQKPVEQTPAVAPATETTPATEAPAAAETSETPTAATEAAPAEQAEGAKDAAENKDAAAEQPKEDSKDAKKEVTPASEGQLGYKAPGLVKYVHFPTTITIHIKGDTNGYKRGLRFSKRFFYFQEEPVEAKNLNVFHQNEKPAVANPIAAWASQTGKGLAFFTKRAEDKAHPAGIFNLADATDITKDGSNEFHFKVGGVKHTFQASSSTERDSWVAALETNSADAKAQKETIVASEGYKSELEKLSKSFLS